MRKITSILILFVVFFTIINVNAQISNGDFEILNQDGLPYRWKDNNLAATISSTPEAHSGQNALKINNIFIDSLENPYVLSGSAYLSNGLEGCGGDFLNEIDTISPYNDTSFNLGFYYKFTAAGGDVALAQLELYGTQNGNLISLGKAEVHIIETNTEYNYIYTAVNFTTTDVTPEYFSLVFSNSEDGLIASLGTSLIIDDVTINNVALQINHSVNNPFIVYPTLANEEINILKENSTIEGNYNFKIITPEGKLIAQNRVSFSNNDVGKIDISQLSKGVYWLTTTINGKENITKFIKR